jgi:hypothetical protein
MASSTRSGSRATAQTQPVQTDAASLSNLERLLFAQAIYEFGANAWPSVTKLLAKHPLMSNRPKSFFTHQVGHDLVLLGNIQMVSCSLALLRHLSSNVE